MSTELFDAFPPPSLELLLAWFRTHDVFLDDRIEVRETQERGWTLVARQAIDLEETVCKTPKLAMFGRRTSSLDVCLGPGADLLPPTHVLALHLVHELLIGQRSPFAGYLQSLPREPPPLAMLWEDWAGEDGRSAWALARGGEVGRRVKRSKMSLGRVTVGGREVEWGAGGMASLERFYEDRVLPTLRDSPALADRAEEARRPTFQTFLHAYAIVSSRCFTVDAYHQIALVPLADLFNHSPDHQVHFTVDEFVCAVCGSLIPCLHDRPKTAVLPPRLSHLQEFEESDLLAIFAGVDSGDICVNAPVEQDDEVYNSYGGLSSAHLACEYGFIPDEAGTLAEDRVHLDVYEAATFHTADLPSVFASRPHPLVESSVLSAHLPMYDRSFVSADGQLSEALLFSLAARAGLEREQAVQVLFDAGEFRAAEWEQLRSAVDISTGPVTRMAATLALAERTTLDACREQWLEDKDDGEVRSDRGSI